MQVVAFDTETHKFGPGRMAPPLVVVSWYDGENNWLTVPDDGVVQMHDYLDREDTILVGHNVPYDLAVMAARDGRLLPKFFKALDEGRILDSRIRESLRLIREGSFQFDPDLGKKPLTSLADCTKRLLGIDVQGKHGEDAWRMRYHELDGVPLSDWPDAARDYALLDAKYTYEVFMASGEQVNEREQTQAAFALHLMTCRGMRTDGPSVEKLKAKLEADVGQAEVTLKSCGIVRPAGSKDMARIREMILACTSEPLMTDKGAVATSEKALREAAACAPDSEAGRNLLALADVSKDKKLLDSFVPVLEQGVQGVIHPGYEVLVDTGRTSSRQPNIQQMPRKGGVRECFVPRPGYVLCSVDYSVAELRSLAQVLLDFFGESKMAEALIEGRELHLDMAAKLAGTTYEDAKARYEKKDAFIKDMRQLAKVVNFGRPGGLGAKKLVDYARDSYGVNITLEQSYDLVRSWEDAYPEMRRYFDRISRLTANGQWFTVEHVRSGRLRGRCGYTDGCNSYFQGLTADGAKAAVYEVVKACYIDKASPLYGTRPVAFIHDEILAEIPDKDPKKRHDAAMELARVMCAAMARFVPDIPIVAEPAIMRKWYKDAEAVYDADGLLECWEPKKAS